MSKPDWTEAPDWANFLVMTIEGRWVWTLNRPKLIEENGQKFWDADCGKWEVVRQENWINTLEQRPRKELE